MKRIIVPILACIFVVGLLGCGCKHEYGEWEVKKEATCLEEGEEERICNKCDDIEKQSIPLGEHKYEWNVIEEKTCSEDGLREGICAVCGEKITEPYKSTGHTFADATNTKPKICTVCGETEGEPLATVFTIGEKIERDDFSFVVSDVYYSKQFKVDASHYAYVVAYDPKFSTTMVLEGNIINKTDEEINIYEYTTAGAIGDCELTISDVNYHYSGLACTKNTFLYGEENIQPLVNEDLYIILNAPEPSITAENEAEIVFKIFGEKMALRIENLGELQYKTQYFYY